MASARSSRLLVLSSRPICPRCLQKSPFPGLRWSSTTSIPLLSKIKDELKAAMRAKDTARLSVLRGTISEINQAASGPNPIKSDMQILALLRKRKVASEAAAKEAAQAQRPDLVEKQEKEIAVVQELTSSVQLMDALEMRKIVRTTIDALRGSSSGEVKPGTVLKELLKPDGALADKPLDNKVLAELVREELFSNHDNSSS